jgi:hypothetical protein
MWLSFSLAGKIFSQEAGYLAFVGVAPGLFFRVNQAAVHHHLEPSAVGRDQGDRFGLGLKLLQQFSRQTGGLFGVVSDRAVLNGDFQQHGKAPRVIRRSAASRQVEKRERVSDTYRLYQTALLFAGTILQRKAGFPPKKGKNFYFFWFF